jgi:hypothetical protein
VSPSIKLYFSHNYALLIYILVFFQRFLSKCKKSLFLFTPISIVVIVGPKKYRDIILSKHSPFLNAPAHVSFLVSDSLWKQGQSESGTDDFFQLDVITNKHSWGRYYDFENIFAKTFGKKIGDFYSNYC